MNEELRKRLAAYGQEHLPAFWDDLDPDDRVKLAQQIDRIDFDLIGRLFCHRDDQTDVAEIINRAGPPPAVRLDPAENRFTPDQARRRGREALAAGQLGVILVAGGQGTRLGFDHPKGQFLIGPVSGRSLFQIHVEKILALGRRYGVRIPLYLMTSPATHDETVRFFDDNERFGLAEDDLIIFCQGTMPVVDAADGRVLLDRPGRIAVSPDGHGGMLAALASSGAMDDIRRRAIEQLFYFQVDNPLVDIGSAELVGHHLLAGSQLTSQVVAKTYWRQRVGNVVEVDGRLQVIEYSDLLEVAPEPPSQAALLAFWAGSIAVHVMDAALLQRSIDDDEALPLHIAKKKVAYIDADGRRIEPTEPNAIKFERFIFDLIPSAEGAIVVEIDPAEGFAPLKNASGAAEDTPEAVKAAMTAQHTRWLQQAGAEVVDGVEVEICPLWALDAEEISRKGVRGTRVTEATYFS